ncbi:hypothetical protein M2480_000751 [Parabacteroides sp. PFB2-12]|uniref:hypothetical protein n=1 Tax=unclassified Parabacteroides TaxID=2649774 RepID=UPI0024750C5F|nr:MULTISPECIES: hypothetical protein [unclassified Parabacteroides]MDH6341792.1 hypothetical protein [Parabacteroides sp. PM6-13]MDH6389785.1 hypothetical protein [Parabacteroides sp. PFB2-12]
MSTFAIHTKRAELIRQIRQETDETVLDRLIACLKKESNAPCQMTPKELEESVDRAIQQYRNGQTITHEEFLKKYQE